MLIVKMMGGLGNQMFQYAVARKLSVQRNEKIFIDLCNYRTDPLRKYELTDYGIDLKEADTESVQYLKKKNKSYVRLDRYLRVNPFYRLGIERTANEYQRLDGATYLEGYWQNLKYFDSIRDLLIKEFIFNRRVLNEKETKIFDEYKEIIDERDSIALHIRRTDYMQNGNQSIYCDLCKTDYYDRAINEIEKSEKKPFFVVFSDDIEWCKNWDKLKEIKNILFVENIIHNSAANMELMRRCMHHIIANSSFSWWAGYLGCRTERKMIVPSSWFVDQKRNETIKTAIYNENMHMI